MELERGTWISPRLPGIAGSSVVGQVTRTGPNANIYRTLYYLDESVPWCRPAFGGGTLRIGAFGATRPLKNLMSAAGAALETSYAVARQSGTLAFQRAHRRWKRDTRRRARHDGRFTSRQTGGIRMAKLAPIPSQSSPHAPASATQLYRIVQRGRGGRLDGFEAIGWAPEHRKAPSDDVDRIARVARYLLADPHAPGDGLEALRKHNRDGWETWKSYLAA